MKHRLDHEILLAELNNYGDSFKSYLSNQQQYVSINGYDSGLTKINCGVLEAFVLGPLLCP